MKDKKAKVRRALVILSGGQDSTTCLFWARQNFDEVEAVTFDYGQRHSREIIAAEQVAEMAEIEQHFLARPGNILLSASPLVNSSNELEQYSDMHSLPGGLEKTFVPGRNLLFLTLAANLAYSRGILNLVTGVCQEDFGGYPDCRQVFIDAAQQAIRLGFGYDDTDRFSELTIHTPLMNMTKADTVHLAKSIPGCWAALAYTHTAYDGQYPPTGHDHATLLRAKGFYEAGLPDPLILRAVEEGLMPLPNTSNYQTVGTDDR